VRNDPEEARDIRHNLRRGSVVSWSSHAAQIGLTADGSAETKNGSRESLRTADSLLAGVVGRV